MKKLDIKEASGVQENIEYLAQRFPHIVTESYDDKGRVQRKVNFDALRQELTDSIIEGPQERYHLNWPGKMQALLKSNEAVDGALRPCPAESVNFDSTHNIFIEGDNLKVLKLLKDAYSEKIKMIYIDPPYNTGRDFIYRDNFKQKSSDYQQTSRQKSKQGEQLVANLDGSGRFHSDWCSMMYSRLKVARYLLRDDGVIFISIDDNEVHNLRKICDEVFGVENFVAQIIIKTNPGGRDYGGVARTHEYVLAFSKHPGLELNQVFDKDKTFAHKDSRGPFDVRALRNANIKFNDKNRPNLCYPIYVNPNDKDDSGLYSISLTRQKNWLQVMPAVSRGVQTVWRWGKPKLQANLNTEVKAQKTKDGRFIIMEKYRSPFRRERSIWDEAEIQTTKGSRALKYLFNDVTPFDYPKSPALIQRLICSGSGPGDIILDFFAGSGSTAHAVMQLNAEDDGKRKFIMVQLPEECNKSQGLERSGATSGQVAFNNEVLIKSENRQDKAQVVASRMGGATSGARRVENYSTIADIGRERIRRAGVQIQENFIDKERHKVGSTREDGVSQVIEKTKQNIQLNKNSASGLDTGFRSFKLDTSNIVDFSQPARDVQQSGLELMGESIKPDRSAEDLLFQVLLQEGLPLHVQVHTKKILDCRVFYVLKQEDDAQDKNIKSNNTQASDVENNRAARVSADKLDDKLKVNHVEGVELSSDDVVQPAQKQRDISLMLCLGTQTQITKSLILKLIEHRPVKIIFREAVFENDSQRVNVDQIFKQLSPSTRVEVI